MLPLYHGRSLSEEAVEEFARILQDGGAFEAIEIITVGVSSPRVESQHASHLTPVVSIHVDSDGNDWSVSARAGLNAATGDHLIVLDLERPYSARSLLEVVRPLSSGNCELVVGVPLDVNHRNRFWDLPRLPLRQLSRVVLGSTDVFSGLFAIRRSLWDRGGRPISVSGSSLVLEMLLRRPTRTLDVPVPIDPEFHSPRLGLKDLRSLKHVLDGRYGNYSRLIQFCAVGASGMFIDLSLYALFQWLLSLSRLVSRESSIGFSWHLAIAAALSIGIALLWNFTLNRRLTFNDATRGAWIPQFLTYALSNALAIALNFSLRLYLPSQFSFFARHRLAAAVVGIIAATGISFSMSRWIVFSRRPVQKTVPHSGSQCHVGQPSTVL